ncbi:MAG: carboxylating nicotinate-nucleotide diphosphorylase [Acidobacteria bacterium]|nr:carboxylating nicotinate-nucleotide diphosphorylase [Acidobacteriota bacterium]
MLPGHWLIEMERSIVRPGPLYPLLYQTALQRALEEDLGRAGDITTDAIVPVDVQVSASLVARSAGRIAGMDVAVSTFRLLDPKVQVVLLVHDGCDASPASKLAEIRGAARPLLSAERTALNLLGRLCGIATATRDIVSAVSASPARVVCTRKTTPGLRALEKYAVRVGGGANHRFGLDDAVLIKDNHRMIAGSVTEAVERVRRSVGHMVKIEVEVDTLDELAEALRLKVDAVLLDNMSPDTLAQGVRMARGKTTTEASGGITPETAQAIAATGVDLLSVGWLTHSAPQLDVSLEVGEVWEQTCL